MDSSTVDALLFHFLKITAADDHFLSTIPDRSNNALLYHYSRPLGDSHHCSRCPSQSATYERACRFSQCTCATSGTQT